MSQKSQLNSLSKREILESLLARQQQDTSTVNRLVLAAALAAGLDPAALAQKFADSAATGDFAEKFNSALEAEFARKRQEEAAAAAAPDTNASSAIQEPAQL